MKIESIELTNYGPFYGTHVFSFSDRGLVLVMGDNQDEPKMNSNGAGKSSIFDGLDWCLFGKVPRGDHADSVCNEEAKSCLVKVNLFNDAGEGAQIVRARGKKSSLEFIENGINRTALDTKETQSLILDYLGLDRDVFHAAVLFGQTDLVHYSESTDSERMEILTKILQLYEIDVLLDKAKNQVTTVTSKLSSLENDLQAQKAVFDNLRTIDFTGQIKTWEEGRQAELINLRNMKVKAENEVKIPTDVLSTLPTLSEQLAVLSNEHDSLIDPSFAECEQLNTKMTQLNFQRDAAQRDCVELWKQMDHCEQAMKQPQTYCNTCGQAVPRGHIEKELGDLKAKHQAKNNMIADLNNQLKGLQDSIRTARNVYDTESRLVVDKKTKLIKQINDLRVEIDIIRLQKNQLQKAEESLKNIDGLINNKECEVNPFIVQEQQNDEAIKQMVVKLQVLASGIADTRHEQEYLNFWVSALGTKGLKSYILDSRLQELTDAANHWVNLLTGGTIWVQFESQKQTRGKKLINSPDVRVCRWNSDGTVTERNFRSWSGGEKQRISFAIDFGLSRLIASRAKQSYDLLILDEVFRHLDRSGKEAVMDMLQTLALEKSSVLVVEHDTEFQSSFESRVVVQKKHRRSTILEVDNGKKKNSTSDSSVSIGELKTGPPVRVPVRRAVTA